MCQAVVAPLPQPTAPADRRHFAPAYAAEVRKLKPTCPTGRYGRHQPADVVDEVSEVGLLTE
jgi:hypothetical protein